LISGIYFSTSGMNVDQKRMEVLSNNLANINSIGFKKRSIVFVNYKDMQIKSINEGNYIGSVSKGLIIDKVSVDLTNGSLRLTQNPFDLAINNNNFFILEDNLGNNLLTKNGSFTLDSDGILVNLDGYKVLGEKGYIKILTPESFVVDSSGNVYANNQFVDKLKIAAIDKPENLVVTNDSYFLFNNQIQPQNEQGVNIKQGFLETSNVNGIYEMADMIAIMRSYEINQKVIKMQDETLSKSVNSVGKLN